jgi:hypothetical protein
MPDIACIGQGWGLARAAIAAIAADPGTDLIVAASERTEIVALSSTLIVKLL